MYPVLALITVLMVPMSLFVGLWANSALLAVVLPFVVLMVAAYFGHKAEEAASRDF